MHNASASRGTPLRHALVACRAAIAFWLVMAVAGCGESPGGVPVTGKVAIKDGGPPLDEGSIVLVPDPFDQDKPQAGGTLGRDGSFSCNMFSGDSGVSPGRYKVTLMFPSPKGHVSPFARSFAQYTKFETTPLSLEVPATGLGDVLLELEEPADPKASLTRPGG